MSAPLFSSIGQGIADFFGIPYTRSAQVKTKLANGGSLESGLKAGADGALSGHIRLVHPEPQLGVLEANVHTNCPASFGLQVDKTNLPSYLSLFLGGNGAHPTGIVGTDLTFKDFSASVTGEFGAEKRSATAALTVAGPNQSVVGVRATNLLDKFEIPEFTVAAETKFDDLLVGARTSDHLQKASLSLIHPFGIHTKIGLSAMFKLHELSATPATSVVVSRVMQPNGSNAKYRLDSNGLFGYFYEHRLPTPGVSLAISAESSVRALTSPHRVGINLTFGDIDAPAHGVGAGLPAAPVCLHCK